RAYPGVRTEWGLAARRARPEALDAPPAPTREPRPVRPQPIVLTQPRRYALGTEFHKRFQGSEESGSGRVAPSLAGIELETMGLGGPGASSPIESARSKGCDGAAYDPYVAVASTAARAPESTTATPLGVAVEFSVRSDQW